MLAEQDKIDIITNLKILRLRKFKSICNLHGWECKIHRRRICIKSKYYGGLRNFTYKREGITTHSVNSKFGVFYYTKF